MWVSLSIQCFLRRTCQEQHPLALLPIITFIRKIELGEMIKRTRPDLVHVAPEPGHRVSIFPILYLSFRHALSDLFLCGSSLNLELARWSRYRV
jgi:hypothetical protein